MWVDADFVQDEIEDCIVHVPDPLTDDKSNAEWEPYVHWHDVMSCISLAILLAKDEPFNTV